MTSLSAISANLGAVTAGSINAAQVTVSNINGSNIASGTVPTARLDVSGIISAGGILVGGSNISLLSNNSGFITGGQVNTNVTAISGGAITTGTINANRINIDNVTLDTDGLGRLIIHAAGVNTDQLATNAVTQVAQDLNSGNQNFTGNSSFRIFREIAAVTLTKTGATVQLGGKFMARSHNDQCLCQFRLKRDSTTLFTSQTFSVRPSPEGIHVPIGFIDTSGTTGSVTYKLEAGLNDEQQNYNDAFLFALETKR